MCDRVSLRLRLALFTSLLIALILSAVAASVYYLTERSLYEAVEARARQALADLSAGAISTGLQRLPGDAYYQIVLVAPAPEVPASLTAIRNGVDYTQTNSIRPNPTPDRILERLPDRALEPLLEGQPLTGSITLSTGEPLRVLGDLGTIAFPNQARALTAAILVGVPTANVVATLQQLRTDLFLTVVLAFLVFAVAVWAVSRTVLMPVQRVTAVASRISSAQLQTRVPVPRTGDELEALAKSINQMLGRLQESFETQRRFTADASHELRTPVTAIVGHAQYLLRRTTLQPEQADSLRVIEREGERMGKLVHDLLELARADAGFEVVRQPLNLREILEAARDDLAPIAGEARITVAGHDPLIEVEGDPARLKQVVLNLVANALEAGAKNVQLSLARDQELVRMQVLDDGPGIPADAIPHLFDRFYRVDGARSSRGNGSGLGLSIVRWIVQQHQGDVQVESKVGEGTVFTIELPAHGSEPESL